VRCPSRLRGISQLSIVDRLCNFHAVTEVAYSHCGKINYNFASRNLTIPALTNNETHITDYSKDD